MPSGGRLLFCWSLLIVKYNSLFEIIHKYYGTGALKVVGVEVQSGSEEDLAVESVAGD